MTTKSSESFNRVFTKVRSLPMSRIIEFSFHKCNEYFVKRWELTQRNIAEKGHFGKAEAEHLKEADELASSTPSSRMDPAAISLVYEARVAQAWATKVMVDETTELILEK